MESRNRSEVEFRVLCRECERAASPPPIVDSRFLARAGLTAIPGFPPGSLDWTGLGLVWGDLRSWGGDRQEGKPRRFGRGRGARLRRICALASRSEGPQAGAGDCRYTWPSGFHGSGDDLDRDVQTQAVRA